ncbi:predicted protein [Arabidopsis lyrata subsp. lyrata]|uniref:Predicted protein n=1 Tax=Arabidopsis lyrata subsp. lyrata TaxID=81972 RepID=D7LNN1_ARALL|nr:predicted protein [Arabidopsis lyrata subsp. lyrata]
MLTRTSWSHGWCTVTRMRNVISARISNTTVDNIIPRDFVYTINIGIGVTFAACILYTFCCVRTLVQTMLTRTSWSHRWCTVNRVISPTYTMTCDRGYFPP